MFNTPIFIFVFLIFLILFWATPGKFRTILLVLFSFAWSYYIGGVETTSALALIILWTYYASIEIQKLNKQRLKKLICVFYVLSVVALLFVSKYAKFFICIIRHESIEDFNSFFAMVGLSYYSFSGISYVVDVYIGRDEADKDILNVSLWMSFFAKLVAGPIERHKSFSEYIASISGMKFDFERIKRGLLICSKGYFYKIVIADRLCLYVDFVYMNLDDCYGITIIVAMLLYSLQIYFDFAGYTFIARGVAHSLGIELSENFRYPYFSGSISEFWGRWHISLSTWLRDYIYIPLGGNRRGKARQYINLLITFIISGLWHGSGTNYLAWGALHGLAQITEKHFKNNKRAVPFTMRSVGVFAFVSFAWIFFRAKSIGEAVLFIRHMFNLKKICLNTILLTDCGLDYANWCILFVSIVISILAEIYQYKGFSIYCKIQKQNVIIRWILYYLIIFALLIFGKYSGSFDASSFIYFQY